MRPYWLVGMALVLGCAHTVAPPVPMELPQVTAADDAPELEALLEDLWEERAVQPFVLPSPARWPKQSIKAIQQANQAALIVPRQGDFVNAEVVFRYCRGCRYRIDVALNQPVTVMLQPGERIQVFSHGDPRFLTQRSQEVDPQSVTFKATWANVQTSTTIVTDQGVYLLELHGQPTTGLAFVSWKHPEERQVRARTTGTYGIGYGTQGRHGASFEPLFGWHDGRHTYLLFPERMWVTGVPVVHVRRGDRSHLVNYQTFEKLSVIKVNRLLADGEAFELGLTPDAEEAVRVVKSESHQDITCPGHEACEVIRRYTPRIPTRRTATRGH